MPLQQLNHSVNVVGHDTPCQKPIALLIEVQRGVLDESGDISSIEPAGTETSIKLPIDLCWRILAKT